MSKNKKNKKKLKRQDTKQSVTIGSQEEVKSAAQDSQAEKKTSRSKEKRDKSTERASRRRSKSRQSRSRSANRQETMGTPGHVKKVSESHEQLTELLMKSQMIMDKAERSRKSSMAADPAPEEVKIPHHIRNFDDDSENEDQVLEIKDA